MRARVRLGLFILLAGITGLVIAQGREIWFRLNYESVPFLHPNPIPAIAGMEWRPRGAGAPGATTWYLETGFKESEYWGEEHWATWDTEGRLEVFSIGADPGPGPGRWHDQAAPSLPRSLHEWAQQSSPEGPLSREPFPFPIYAPTRLEPPVRFLRLPHVRSTSISYILLDRLPPRQLLTRTFFEPTGELIGSRANPNLEAPESTGRIPAWLERWWNNYGREQEKTGIPLSPIEWDRIKAEREAARREADATDD